MSKNSFNQVIADKGVLAFRQRMADMFWTTNPLPSDTGEDFLVKVFDKPPPGETSSRPSALSFATQVKATENYDVEIGALQLAHDFKTEHLEDWENNQPPVVLILWDLETNTGYWRIAQEACIELDRTNPDWKTQKTNRVKFPVGDSTTEDASLQRLRARLAKIVYPSVARGRPLEMKLNFSLPRPVMKQLNKARDAGTPFSIDAAYVKSVEFPEWFERLMGKGNFEITGPIEINKNPPTDEVLKAEVEARLDGDMELVTAELKMVRVGRKEVELSNWDDKDAPLQVKVVLRKGKSKLSIRLNMLMSSPTRHYPAVKLMAQARKGAKLRLVVERNGKRLTLGNSAVNGVSEEIDLLLEATKHFRTMEAFADEYSGVVDLGQFEDRETLNGFARIAEGCRTGEPIEGASAEIEGVLPKVRKDAEPKFGFDKMFNVAGALIKLPKRAYVTAGSPEQMIIRKSKNYPGKLDITLENLRIRVDPEEEVKPSA